MSGNDWPLLVPDPPGQEGKWPVIMPTIPSINQGRTSMSSEDRVTLDAYSLTNAYHQLQTNAYKQHLQPVPVGSEFLCKDNLKMRVVQDGQKMEWDLMRVAVSKRSNGLSEGCNKEDKALDGPQPSSCLYTGSPGLKAVPIVKKRRRQKMTLRKKKQLENRSLFCGPKKAKEAPADGRNSKNPNGADDPKYGKKKRKPKKLKAGGENAQEAAVGPEVGLS